MKDRRKLHCLWTVGHSYLQATKYMYMYVLSRALAQLEDRETTQLTRH